VSCNVWKEKKMKIYKTFELIYLVLLTVPLQVIKNAFIGYSFDMVKAITNFGNINVALIANKDSNSTFVDKVSKRTGPLLQLVGLALTESKVLALPCKVKVTRHIQTVS
jgi:hypothetical protein